jgi:hypothetical protein
MKCCRKLHNEEFHNLYFASNVIRAGGGRIVAGVREMKDVQHFGPKNFKEETTWRWRQNWENNIKIN